MQLKFGEFSSIEYQLETLLEVMQFCLLEPITLGFFPYQAGDEEAISSAVKASSGTLRTEVQQENVDDSSPDSEVRELIKKLGTESVDVHRKCVKVLKLVAGYTHGNRIPSDWARGPCSKELGDMCIPAAIQNSVLSSFLYDAVRYGQRNPLFTRHASQIVSLLVQRRVESFEQYLEKLSAKIDQSSLTYWKKYGRVMHDDAMCASMIGSGDNSSYVFPGRLPVRQCITFDKVDKQECTKHYFKGTTSAVPSFLTVQCACAHPKVLGFIILNRCESISAALSAILTISLFRPETSGTITHATLTIQHC